MGYDEGENMGNISVIMPLYNAAKYLPEALQSVLNQTYKDFELICINDCSTDDTGKILVDFQRKDKRIRILSNTKHSGAGPSRNRGLEAANGEYVIFLDGDDIFEEELLETAYMTMEKKQIDIIMFEYSLHVPDELMYVRKNVRRSKRFVETYCKEPFAVEDFEPRDFPDWFDSPWNKMFRRRFLEEHKLQFQDLPSCNDVYFVKMALFCARKIIWMNDRRVMVYAREHSEPSRISNLRNPMCACYAMEKLADELDKRGMFGEFSNYYYYALTAVLPHLLAKEKKEECRKKFYRFLKNKEILKYIQFGGADYERVDGYYRYVLEYILNNTYESNQLNSLDTYFQFYLKQKGEVVLTFIKNELNKGKKIVLWGVGVNGKIFLEYLDENAVRISAITDTDQRKEGNIVNGYRIGNPAEICKIADLIITTSRQILWDIEERTDSLKVERTDILEILKEG